MNQLPIQPNIVHIVSLVALFSVVPLQSLHASEVTFTVAPNPVVGDTATIVEVRVDPQNAPVNVIQGTIQIVDTPDNVTTVLIETGGSLLTLWPGKPTYYPNTKSISFTGGSRTNLSEEGLLFRLRIFSSSAASISLVWADITMYLGDGKATILPVTKHSITVATEKGTPNPINTSSADSIPPVIEQIEMGKNDEVYEGKNFIHVTSNDNKSGIDHITVTENGKVTEAINDTYLLQEQEHDPEVLVTAYDKAGNSTSLTFPQKKRWGIYVVFVLFFTLFSITIHVKNKKERHKKTNSFL